MILLEFSNTIITTYLGSMFNSTAEKPETIDYKFSDFDGALFHLTNVENKQMLNLSISWKCFSELKSYGAEDILKGIYGEYFVAPISGYDVTLRFDLSKLPANKDELIEKAALLKRHTLAAPFVKAFDAQEKGQTTDLMPVRYRDQEAIFIQAQKDRVTVIFSTSFKEETDNVFGKVFLQEFVDARKTPALQNAPQVLFYPRDPPSELQGVKGAISSDNMGYVTFVLNPRHYGKANRDRCISLIQTFRDYLHYHIKCSKAFMHSRMRARVASFLKVLNRAKPDIQTEKKTASGKSFKKF